MTANSGGGRRGTSPRAVQAVVDVLPRSVDVSESTESADLVVNGQPIEIAWAGTGDPRHVRGALERRGDLSRLIVVGRRLSPGARELLSDRGIGWADETGAAEIAVGSLVVSRTGMPEVQSHDQRGWTRSVFAVVEAILCGTKATVDAVADATHLSTGSCTTALRFLADRGLLESSAARGRTSARRVVDMESLLDEYAHALEAAKPDVSLAVGINSRDIVGGLLETGRRWDVAGVEWAATGAAAASVIAPYLTTVSSSEVYVTADTSAGLDAVAATAGLRPMKGGRLTLRPFPTAAVRQLAHVAERLRVAPWPRVYVDLRGSGVRGEEAAEHLLEVIDAKRGGAQQGGTRRS